MRLPSNFGKSTVFKKFHSKNIHSILKPKAQYFTNPIEFLCKLSYEKNNPILYTLHNREQQHLINSLQRTYNSNPNYNKYSDNMTYNEEQEKLDAIEEKKRIMKQMEHDDLSDEDINKLYQQTLEAMTRMLFSKPNPTKKREENITAMKHWLKHFEIDHEALNIIHIAGTKGKGSTSTMTEYILREAGYTTGLFTSPHLIDVRERIVINGQPIAKKDFIQHYWELTEYGSDSSIASYFRFLTLMALKAFVQAKVDVVILEVGIGGRLDATNVVTPVVCGITSIGFDHEAILGHTLTAIAKEKSGIFKAGIPAIVQPQLDEAMDAIRAMSKEKHAPLWYSRTSTPYQLNMLGEHQQYNAAQALALSDYFMNVHPLSSLPQQSLKLPETPLTYPSFEPTPGMIRGLTQARYGGRGHVLHLGGHVFFVDGAHTMKSIELATKWFQSATLLPDTTLQSQSWFFNVDDTMEQTPQLPPLSGNVNKRICIFNFTKNRSPESLLYPLLEISSFDEIWIVPCDSKLTKFTKGGELSEAEQKQQIIIKHIIEKENGPSTRLFNSIHDSMLHLSNQTTKHHVFVTGSLYLVGDYIRYLSILHHQKDCI